jgi:MinD superfamily P-loop ATPase
VTPIDLNDLHQLVKVAERLNVEINIVGMRSDANQVGVHLDDPTELQILEAIETALKTNEKIIWVHRPKETR